MRVDTGTIPLPVRTVSDATTPLRANGPGLTPAGTLGGADRAEGASFAESLVDALRRVNDTQVAADVAIERVATGEAENLHDAVLAVETADLSLRLTAQVTQRAVEAYREISRLQL